MMESTVVSAERELDAQIYFDTDKEVKTNIKDDVCPECGFDMIPAGGCLSCNFCGFSYCG